MAAGFIGAGEAPFHLESIAFYDGDNELSGPDLNAGSILTLMGLGATQGTVVTLKAEGEGADAALDGLVTFLETDHDAEG